MNSKILLQVVLYNGSSQIVKFGSSLWHLRVNWEPKGHFTLWPLAEWTRDSRNLIGGEQKFVYSPFSLKTNGQRTKASKMPTCSTFGSFGTKSLSGGGKLVFNIYGNPNSPQADKLFFLNLYKVYNLYSLMDFYLVLWKRVCPRSSQSHSRSVKCP
jgi:hypothetical protein